MLERYSRFTFYQHKHSCKEHFEKHGKVVDIWVARQPPGPGPKRPVSCATAAQTEVRSSCRKKMEKAVVKSHVEAKVCIRDHG